MHRSSTFCKEGWETVFAEAISVARLWKFVWGLMLGILIYGSNMILYALTYVVLKPERCQQGF